MADSSGGDSIDQGLSHMLLGDNITENQRAVFAGKNKVAHIPLFQNGSIKSPLSRGDFQVKIVPGMKLGNILNRQ
jgi:hypothetical protein